MFNQDNVKLHCKIYVIVICNMGTCDSVMIRVSKRDATSTLQYYRPCHLSATGSTGHQISTAHTLHSRIKTS